MSEQKPTAVVICPGRGTYNSDELGYLARYHADKTSFIADIDRERASVGQPGVAALDAREMFSIREHTRGDNASALIYACAYADFLAIDRGKFDIVAVTGNSMGWYVALACSRSLAPMDALAVINTMGTWMQSSLVGGQLVYPLVNEHWKPIPGRREQLTRLLREIGVGPMHALYLSIDLGGAWVFGGDEAGLAALSEKLEPERPPYPLRLYNHAAFHTPLQQPVSTRALGHFDARMFTEPAIPLIDGCGRVWSPFAADPSRMHAYTFGHQVCRPYDFARALEVAVREFAPDNLIVLGPGNALGGAVAQVLTGIHWKGLHDKHDFTTLQAESPFVLSMGRVEQRPLVETR